MKYTQCLLVKYDKDGVIKTVAWIPEKFAKHTRTVNLKQDDGTWNKNWTIQEIYNTQEEDYILTHERDWAKQREASDI